MAEVADVPGPHRALLEEVSQPERVAGALSRLRDEIAQDSGELLDVLCLTAFRAVSEESLVQDLDGLLESLDSRDLESMLSFASKLRARLVSHGDRHTAMGKGLDARGILQSPAGEQAVSQVVTFLALQEDPDPMTIVPYPLSALCEFSFGSLTKDLLTLGIHPAAEALQIAGVAVHELVHACLAGARSADIPNGLDRLEEPLATAIGNGWFTLELGGKPDQLPWYDDEETNHHAHVIYPIVAAGLDGRLSISELVPLALDAMGFG